MQLCCCCCLRSLAAACARLACYAVHTIVLSRCCCCCCCVTDCPLLSPASAGADAEPPQHCQPPQEHGDQGKQLYSCTCAGWLCALVFLCHDSCGCRGSCWCRRAACTWGIVRMPTQGLTPLNSPLFLSPAAVLSRACDAHPAVRRHTCFGAARQLSAD